ncbi:glycerol-3-phosphate dehydrogenase C-terminal domain-containing protein, partial [Francisella tularensis]|uniref:glycerol-3-phosphate dehydrogenase C-terminal domain-containing protein n=1 Tax=Francisella tularensis TaxID=263 RepID=UPI0019AB755B
DQLLIDAHEPIDTYPLKVYGTNAEDINTIHKEFDNFEILAIGLKYYHAEVVYYVRHEKAKPIEDVLARRYIKAFLDIKAIIDTAPKNSELLVKYIGKATVCNIHKIHRV